jgi:hypothetical protein
MMALVAVVAAGLAAVQFAAPAWAPINIYARYEGDEVLEVARVVGTGRARVSSTFSYIAGFADFATIVPFLLFAFGPAETNKKVRLLIFVAAALTLGTMPMAGSRAPFLLSGAALTLVVWRAGFLRTKTGRRTVFGAILATVGTLVCVPEAFEGVSSRFHGSDTANRYEEWAELFPPLAIWVNVGVIGYPPLGEGTGTQQNAGPFFGVRTQWLKETEPAKLLGELGVAGYLLIWLTKVGLALALVKISRSLKARGSVAMASGALAVAFFALAGSSVFDHIWRALLFVGVGFFLAAVESLERASSGGPGTSEAHGPVSPPQNRNGVQTQALARPTNAPV